MDHGRLHRSARLLVDEVEEVVVDEILRTGKSPHRVTVRKVPLVHVAQAMERMLETWRDADRVEGELWW